MYAINLYLRCVDGMYVFGVSELLPEILSTGVKEDRMSIVNLILSTLKTRVSAHNFTHLCNMSGDEI